MAASEIAAVAQKGGVDVADEKVSRLLDEADDIKEMRAEFLVPQNKDLPNPIGSLAKSEDDCVYLCGNSLGLQPKQLSTLVNEELDKWGRRGVIGHFDDSPRPWVSIDETVTPKISAVVGADKDEVAVMNTLTVNLNLLMVPFYRPTKERYKIIMESKAFPSDFYAMREQLKFHNLSVEDALIEVEPREGEHCIREEDIFKAIEEHGDQTALVMFSGVQFYNGQFFDIEAITKAAHVKGCIAGFDLAHAVGNVILKLHDWDVDFACWCSYKYLNSGPGGIAGAFIHNKHRDLKDRPRFAGWWGVDPATRFDMTYDTPFIPGVQGLQMSNPPVLQTVSLLASLNLFEKVGMDKLRAKSLLLTGYLELLIAERISNNPEAGEAGKIVKVISPTNPERRGCQLSLLFTDKVLPIFNELEKRGVVCDKREPNVLRIAPVPMYNTFHDVWQFVEYLRQSLAAIHSQ